MLRSLTPEGRVRRWQIETLSDYMEFVANTSTPERTIFRGQRRDDPLLPVIARSPREYDPLKEQELLEAFKREARPHVQPIGWSDWDWMVLARQYGLPTTLLDFSTNPLAALWFAVEENDTDTESVVVWTVRYNEQAIVPATYTPFTQAGAEARVYRPNHVTSRIVAQGAIFVWLPPRVGVQGRLDDYPPFDVRADGTFVFEKAIIDARCRRALCSSIEQCGVHYASMYPGLDGIAIQLRREAHAAFVRGGSR